MNRQILAVMMIGGLLTAGCTQNALGQEAVEQEISDRLEQEVGVAPQRVECPGDLEAEVGTTMRCTLTAPDGSQIGLTVTVTGVDGDTAQFDIQVDDQPIS